PTRHSSDLPPTPPVRPPPVAVVPAHDVKLVLRARVVCDGEVRVAVGDHVAAALESLDEIVAQRAVRDRVHEHRVVCRWRAAGVPLGYGQNAERVEVVDTGLRAEGAAHLDSLAAGRPAA